MKHRWILLIAVVMLAACAPKWERMELASLFNDSETEGNFFLGCGTINEVEYLFAWAKDNESGGWKRIQVAAHWSRVFMDEDKAPYMIWNTNTMITSQTPVAERIVSFHVPAGTIIRKYELR